jgi:hypothetical protein
VDPHPFAPAARSRLDQAGAQSEGVSAEGVRKPQNRRCRDRAARAAWSRWLLWDGSRWTFDCTLTAVNLARKVCREAAAECNKTKTANVIASAKTVMAVERLAKADPHHAATTDQRDADVWLLNTPSGAIDLRTGKGRPHQHENYCTNQESAFAVGSPANITARRQLKHSPQVAATGTRPILPVCVEPGLLQPSKPKKAGAGPRAESTAPNRGRSRDFCLGSV